MAGLRAAIELAPAGRVLVVAKDSLQESASQYAQGGIAAALSDDDEVDLHEKDTLAAGDGLCDAGAVRVLVEDAPRAIEELIGFGAEFDREDGELMFGREGAHSRNRILHAHGDSTGREIARALYVKAASLSNIEFRTFAAVSDLAVVDGEVVGAWACDQKPVMISARAVLLATGGLGRIYKETTNPNVATGDGVAIAYRAGATIQDIEFVQFHPTALHLDGAPRFLLSEALRGDGAYLRNAAGERFTEELAPRDVVSRAIVAEIKRTGQHVFLDMTHFGPGVVEKHFPRIYETCLKYGLDISREPAPVHPAAHYAMGGVRTDLYGRTDVGRLFAAGEVASTGVHGANRLASNSLLEGLVFGARAGVAMRESSSVSAAAVEAPALLQQDCAEATLRQWMWDDCGIVRSAGPLSELVSRLESLPIVKGRDFERRNIAQVAELIARCALAREESRGGHYRTDFPEKRAEFERHTLAADGVVRFA